VEKLANQTDGRWTRGLHKKTSDQIAEQHLKMLGQSQLPAEPPPPGKGVGEGAARRTQGPKKGGGILRPFELFQSEESIKVALLPSTLSFLNSILYTYYVNICTHMYILYTHMCMCVCVCVCMCVCVYILYICVYFICVYYIYIYVYIYI
jgi:hypothetical protein